MIFTRDPLALPLARAVGPREVRQFADSPYPSNRDHSDEVGRSMTRRDSRPVLSSSVGLTDESLVIVEVEPEGGVRPRASECTCGTNSGVEPDESPGDPRSRLQLLRAVWSTGRG